MFDLAAAGLVVTALFAYFNHRFLKLPMTIGVMAIALVLSLSLIGLERLGFSALLDYESKMLRSIDFSALLMQGMLSLLLFAGALHVDLKALRRYRRQVATLSLLGTTLSTVLIGYGLYGALPIIGFHPHLSVCLVFGALISPTDPIAVMNMLRAAKGPESLSTVIAGESLFNDGIGVVLYTMIGAIAFSGATPTVGHTVYLFAREALGGLAFGAALGVGTIALLKHIESYQEEVLLTLAAVVGGYALANHLEVSGPLATVVAGVVIGNRDHRHAGAAPHATHASLSLFWELLDAVLNAVLFVLMGLEVILIPWDATVLYACMAAIAVCLLARWVSAGAPVQLFPRLFELPAHSGLLLTWGGLRGGISVALALSLPGHAHRDLILSMTYAVVAVSILGQGLSFGWLVRRTLA